MIERVQALLAAGRAGEAIALLEPQARAHPERFELWDCLGRAYGMGGRHAQAEAAFRETVRLRPDLFAPHFNLGLAISSQNRLRESVAHFVMARSIEPRSPDVRQTLLPILMKLLQQERAPSPDRRFAPLAAEPLVSVITPTKNRAAMLADAIASVQKQTYRRWELIVVNDGGADVGALVSRAGNARYLERRASGGPAAARNAGVAAARGEVIAFLDDDNLYLPGHLEGLVAALRGQSAALAYSSAERVTERLDGTRRIELKREPLVPDLRPARDLLLVRNFIDMSTVAARRECFAEYGAFDEDPAVLGFEDWELLLRYSAHVRLHPVRKVTLEYRITTLAGDSVTKQHGRKHRERVQAVYRRHEAPGQELVVLARALYLETLG